MSAHRNSYRYEDYERDLLSLLDRLRLDRVAVAGHSLGGYVALLAATRSDRIDRIVAIDVKSDWTEADAAAAARAEPAVQRAEPERETLVARLVRGLAPAVLSDDEVETLAERSIEPVDGSWRFRWDRRVLATEPVEPFAFLARVRCPVAVVAGSDSDVMPPESAQRFGDAIPEATVEVVEGAGHHVELDAPELLARRIIE